MPHCRRAESSFIQPCLEQLPASRWVRSRTRRVLEIVIAFLALAALSIPMLLIGACVRLSSQGCALFKQDRVGAGGRLFTIIKFRSMAKPHTESAGLDLTVEGDPRVTRLGHLLRKSKLDELPQLVNILRGDMSMVGPRPKLPRYADLLNMPYRPGISSPATLAFFREDEILRDVDPNQIDTFYAEKIKPLKKHLDVCYMCRATPLSDLQILVLTILGCLLRARVRDTVLPHTGAVADTQPAPQ